MRIGHGLRAFAAFWWDFVVGDDWRIAAGVVVASGSASEVLTAETLRIHYGADVTVSAADDGTVVVIPRRTRSIATPTPTTTDAPEEVGRVSRHP